MKPQITVITIGVDSLEKSVSFYRDGLGLPTMGLACRRRESLVLSLSMALSLFLICKQA